MYMCGHLDKVKFFNDWRKISSSQNYIKEKKNCTETVPYALNSL